MSEPKRKIFCFNNGGSDDWWHAAALSEDGHFLAGHVCSNEGFMRHDLGMDGSNWKQEHYDAHFGAGNWELEWVPTDMVKDRSHKGMEAAYRLHLELAKKEAPPDL